MIRVLALTAALLAGAAVPAFAQDTPGPGQGEPEAPAEPPLSFNLGVATDYIYRGITQTGGDPQLFAGADYERASFYAGAWGSNVDFGEGEGRELELDVYGGWRPEALGFTFDLGALFYAFPGSDTGYVEGKASATKAVGKAEAGAALYWAPDTKGREGEGLYYEATGAYALTDRLTLSAVLGRQEDDDFGAYNTWNLGAEIGLTDRISLDARYWDTDTDQFGSGADSRVVAGIKAEF